MSTYKTKGIIIRRNDFGESSLILSIYTEDYGRIEAVARSARKAKGKLKGHLELFLLVELMLARGRNIDTITSSLTIESFAALRNNLELSFAAYYILELLWRMTAEGYKDKRVFYLAKETLMFLDKLAREAQVSQKRVADLSLGEICRRSQDFQGKNSGKKSDNGKVHFSPAAGALNAPKHYLALLFFQINILDLVGFSPEIRGCVFCAGPLKENSSRFSFARGGLLCRKCSERDIEAVPVEGNAIKLFRLLQIEEKNEKEYILPAKERFEMVEKLVVKKRLAEDAVFLLNRFIEFNIEGRIKAADFLRFCVEKPKNAVDD